jgi:hypothetical protein
MNLIVGRQLFALAAAVGLLLHRDLRGERRHLLDGGRERASAGPHSTDPAVTGGQPLYDLSPELQDQIGTMLIGPALDIDGVQSMPLIAVHG